MSVFDLIRFIVSHPVNRRQRLAAIGRFAKWQIASRMAPGAILYEWIDGSRFLVKNGDTGLTGNIYTGLHEFSDMAFILHYLRSEDMFVDIGANMGSYTILAGSVIGASGFAFEPVPHTYSRLIENIRLNRMDDRVHAFNIGLAESEGHLRFTNDLDTMNRALLREEGDASFVEVEVKSLDQALVGHRPTLMKIDVEGYETPVLEGARNTLCDPILNAIIMELNGSGSRYGFDEDKALKLMADNGFRAFSYSPLTRTLSSLVGKNNLQGNTLFIRDLAQARERVESAPKFSVLGLAV